MSENSFRERLAGKGQEVLENLSADKLRNNFYGYLIISFLFFNFENIILILKSKEKIEMTLIYIQAQQDFSWNFFWKPLWYGIAASLIMPIVTAAYVVFTGVFDAIRTESKGFGSTLWERVKVSNKSKLNDAKNALEVQEKLLASKEKEHAALQRGIRELRARQSNLETHLTHLVDVYGKYNNNNQHRDIVGFIKEIDKAGVWKHFPQAQLLNDMTEFIRSNTPQSEDEKPIINEVSNTSGQKVS